MKVNVVIEKETIDSTRGEYCNSVYAIYADRERAVQRAVELTRKTPLSTFYVEIHEVIE